MRPDSEGFWCKVMTMGRDGKSMFVSSQGRRSRAMRSCALARGKPPMPFCGAGDKIIVRKWMFITSAGVDSLRNV